MSSPESPSRAPETTPLAPPSPAAPAEPGGWAERIYALAFFQEFLRELRAARQLEQLLTFGFAFLLVAFAGGAMLFPRVAWWVRALAVVGLGTLGWRMNSFLAENRNRQNQIKKVITATEHS